TSTRMKPSWERRRERTASAPAEARSPCQVRRPPGPGSANGTVNSESGWPGEVLREDLPAEVLLGEDVMGGSDRRAPNYSTASGLPAARSTAATARKPAAAPNE